LPVRFERLQNHPPVAPVPDPQSAGVSVDADDDQHAQADLAPTDQGSLATAAEMVTEDRALWVEPGYLLLLRWTRPVDDLAAVAALEGSAETVHTFLATRVTNVDTLHNLDQLHPLEAELVVLLNARVAPTTIEVIHLDHDCTRVCSLLNPSRTYPEVIEVDGGMPAPGWE
jgi:hypothetical protein